MAADTQLTGAWLPEALALSPRASAGRWRQRVGLFRTFSASFIYVASGSEFMRSIGSVSATPSAGRLPSGGRAAPFREVRGRDRAREDSADAARGRARVLSAWEGEARVYCTKAFFFLKIMKIMNFIEEL